MDVVRLLIAVGLAVALTWHMDRRGLSILDRATRWRAAAILVACGLCYTLATEVLLSFA
jgi:hypothetical protein